MLGASKSLGRECVDGVDDYIHPLSFLVAGAHIPKRRTDTLRETSLEMRNEKGMALHCTDCTSQPVPQKKSMSSFLLSTPAC